MINAETKENITAEMFLVKVAFLPKVLISIGIVTTPTIVSVQMNATICVIPAPLFSNAEANGNATNPGISVIEPTSVAISTPNTPEFEPIKAEIALASRTLSVIPMMIIILKNCGSMLVNDFKAFFSASIALFLSLMKVTISPIMANKYKKQVNIKTP